MAEIDATIGKLIANRYLIKSLLGRGGMGRVYLAEDTLLGNEKLALKLLHSELGLEQRHTQRFLREIQLTRKVSHPNVVKAYDVGTEGGTLFLTMEFAEGTTLKELLSEQTRLSSSNGAAIINQIAKGLMAIHEAEVIHRDLKPANIIIDDNGVTKITDFGIARPQAGSELTAVDEVIGSTPYLAPEIWKGSKIDNKVDLYALGVMAYEMLTGDVPFIGNSPTEYMRGHLEKVPVPLSEKLQEIPPWLNALVLRLLAKDPENRPASAGEVSEIIEANLVSRKAAGFVGQSVVDEDLLSYLGERRNSSATVQPQKEDEAQDGETNSQSARLTGTETQIRNGLVRKITRTSNTATQSRTNPGLKVRERFKTAIRRFSAAILVFSLLAVSGYVAQEYLSSYIAGLIYSTLPIATVTAMILTPMQSLLTFVRVFFGFAGLSIGAMLLYMLPLSGGVQVNLQSIATSAIDKLLRQQLLEIGLLMPNFHPAKYDNHSWFFVSANPSPWQVYVVYYLGLLFLTLTLIKLVHRSLKVKKALSATVLLVPIIWQIVVTPILTAESRFFSNVYAQGVFGFRYSEWSIACSIVNWLLVGLFIGFFAARVKRQ